MNLMKNFLFQRLWLLCGFLFWGMCSAQAAVPDDKDGVQVGDTVPDFSLVCHRGLTWDASVCANQPMVLVFFNTQCRDCRKELPKLEKLYREVGSDIRFLCVSRAESDSAVSVFWAKHGLTMPYSAQPDKAVFNLFARRTIPRVYVIGGGKVVREKFVEHVSVRKLRAAISRVCREE